MRIHIVTFNDAETSAVREYLSDLANLGGWHLSGSTARSPSPDKLHTIEHKSLRAQGNLTAASALANVFRPEESHPDLLLFYGCCGSIEKEYLKRPFLINHVHYMALGKVQYSDPDDPSSEELVTLKSKWLVPTATAATPHTFMPFDSNLIRPLAKKCRIDLAVAIATESVIRVGPAVASPTSANDTEWSYGQGIRFLTERSNSKFKDLPILIDMESQGIALFANQLDVQSQVLVLRIVTDSLTDKEKHDQGKILLEGIEHLKRLIDTLLEDSMADIGESPTPKVDTARQKFPSPSSLTVDSSISSSLLDEVLGEFKNTQANWMGTVEFRGDWYFDTNSSVWRPQRTAPVSAAAAFVRYCASTGRSVGLGDIRGNRLGTHADKSFGTYSSLALVLDCLASYETRLPKGKSDWVQNFFTTVASIDNFEDLGLFLNLAFDSFLTHAALAIGRDSKSTTTARVDRHILNPESRNLIVQRLLSQFPEYEDSNINFSLGREAWLNLVISKCGARLTQMATIK